MKIKCKCEILRVKITLMLLKFFYCPRQGVVDIAEKGVKTFVVERRITPYVCF